MNECSHGRVPGWCLDCLNTGDNDLLAIVVHLTEENKRLKEMDRRTTLVFERFAKTCRDMLDPIRRAGPVYGVPETCLPAPDAKQARHHEEGMGLSDMQED